MAVKGGTTKETEINYVKSIDTEVNGGTTYYTAVYSR